LQKAFMNGLRLNLGCGAKKLPGFVNVDKFGEPDLRYDLEVLPWPWDDNSVAEILLNHVLEHLGQAPSVFLGIMSQMYRVCRDEARITIVVPHPRHDYFLADPTHVRAITPFGLSLFSQRLNRQWVADGAANTPLGIYLGVDFELVETLFKPSAHWFRLHPGTKVEFENLLAESALYNNLIEEIRMTLKVVKPPA
jgi:hypothetical protein